MDKISTPKFEWTRTDGKDLGHSENEFGQLEKPKSVRVIEAYTIIFT